ncbi:MAG: DUF5009 domain-containing protein [Rikenellaceae bacterium]
MAQTTPTPNKRLESLDILRGTDLFFLVLIERFIHSFTHALDTPFGDAIVYNFTHVKWEGFAPWDLVMPLFMFMAGVSMPFSLNKYRGENGSKKGIYIKITKRFLILWVFGMLCQGNLLALDPGRIYLFSNTLQAIAIGYFFTAILFINFSTKTLIAIAGSCLVVFWAAMEFITIDGFGGGDYTPAHNLAEWVDRVVLGRFRDGAIVENGEVIFSARYNYTWILSSINFVVTVMTGLFAGIILKNRETSGLRKVLLMLGIGAAMVAAGWLWGLQHPVIKKIWTSSMTLVSSGYCFLLMGIFYYVIDYKSWSKGLKWLKVLGMNSILAYMLMNVMDFSSLGDSLLFGFKQYVGHFYPALILASQSVIIYLILLYLYKKKIFLKI